MSTEAPVMTIQEVCAYFRLSRRQWQRIAHRLPVISLSRKCKRYARADVMYLAEELKQGGWTEHKEALR